MQQLKLFGCRALQVAKPCLCQALRTLCSHRHLFEPLLEPLDPTRHPRGRDRAAAASNEAEEDKEGHGGAGQHGGAARRRGRPPAA